MSAPTIPSALVTIATGLHQLAEALSAQAQPAPQPTSAPQPAPQPQSAPQPAPALM